MLARSQNIAKTRGGLCLSQEYVNDRTHLAWQCAEGHVWTASPGNVKAGTWCPECRKTNLRERFRLDGLAEAACIAAERGGRCLAAEYVNSKTPMRWECIEGHQWKASLNSIKSQKAWCIACRRNKKPLRNPKGLEKAREVALERGGTCLSGHYENEKTPLRWRCSQAHEWEAAYASVVNQKTWCSRCRLVGTSKPEEQCRAIFEKLLGLPFPPTKTNWLRGLRFDGYNEPLRLAFEYDGRQHREYTPYFHRSLDDFERQKRNDQLKDELCFDEWVTLVRIPDTVKNLGAFVAKALKELGYTAQ